MFQNAADPAAVAPPPGIDLDPLSLLLHSSGPVRIVNWLLIASALAVWVVAVLKFLQVGRSNTSEREFNAEAAQAQSADQLVHIARRHTDAPGARIVLAIAHEGGSADLVEAHAKRALVAEEQRAGALLGLLSTVGSAGPFVGLFGTVWGILDAFLRIGREKSASLPVVAPAIGEALISTAVGLFAAIPAVILFNIVSKRIDDLLARLEAATETWVAIVKRRPESAAARTDAVAPSRFPPPAPPARPAAS